MIEKELDSVLFSRGFVLGHIVPPPDTDTRLGLPERYWHFHKVEQDLGLYVHHELEFTYFKGRYCSVIVLGLAFLPKGEKDNLITLKGDSLARKLCEVESHSEEAFQDLVDHIFGRFAVIRLKDNKIYIQQDALGLRPVFYTSHEKPPLIASHIGLIERCLPDPSIVSVYERNGFCQKNNIQVWPGAKTAILGIYRQTPNTELELTTRMIRRVFPRSERASVDFEDVFSPTLASLDRVLASLFDPAITDKKILISLSAGFDSRFTTSLMKQHRDQVEFFTYRQEVLNAYSRHDAETAQQICQRFGLKHTLLDMREVTINPQLQDVLEENSDFPHGRKIAQAYVEHYPYGYLQLQSNGYGVVRAHYRKSVAEYDKIKITPEMMGRIISERKGTDLLLRDAFTQWQESVQWDLIRQYGHDELDLFYWEHRMGAWLVPAFHESDISFDSVILINQRKQIERLLSLSYRERAQGRFFIEVINERWPELNEIPINGIMVGQSQSGLYH